MNYLPPITFCSLFSQAIHYWNLFGSLLCSFSFLFLFYLFFFPLVICLQAHKLRQLYYWCCFVCKRYQKPDSSQMLRSLSMSCFLMDKMLTAAISILLFPKDTRNQPNPAPNWANPTVVRVGHHRDCMY